MQCCIDAMLNSGFLLMTDKLSDLRSWQIFIELMTRGSMSRAAAACGCDVSQVSRRMAALEKAVGYPLFERSTRSTLPTRKAKELYERIYPVLSDIDRRIDAVTASVGMRRDRHLVRIQAVSGLMPFLVRTIGAFRETHPDYDFDVRFLSSPPDDETLDADIGIWADTKLSAFLDYRDLRLVPSWLCATPEFAERHDIRTIDDLDRVPLLGCTSWVCPFTLTAGNTLTPVKRCFNMTVRFDSVSALREATRAGLGVAATLPAYACQEDLRRGTLVRVLPTLAGPTLKFRLIRHKTLTPSATVNRFADYLAEAWFASMRFDA